jgi:hypothetical protein
LTRGHPTNPKHKSAYYLISRSCLFKDLVNSLLTISIKVNVLVSDTSRVLTTGVNHEVQKGDCGPRAPELASGLWLGPRRRQRLTEFRPFSAKFAKDLDDLRLGADRLFASAKSIIELNGGAA